MAHNGTIKGWRQQAHYAARVQFDLEMLKATLDAGKEALSALIYISAGGVAVSLGVVGAMFKDGKLENQTNGAENLAYAICIWGVAVFLGALAHGLRYLAQSFHYQSMDPEDDRLHAIGDRYAVSAVWTAVLGYVLFLAGSSFAAYAVWALLKGK